MKSDKQRIILLELVCPKYSMGHSNVTSLLYFCLPRCGIFPDHQVSIQAPSAYYLQLRPMVPSSFKATVTGPRQDVPQLRQPESLSKVSESEAEKMKSFPLVAQEGGKTSLVFRVAMVHHVWRKPPDGE